MGRNEGKSALLSPVPLTGNPGWEGEPSFSPDGTQVAYVWDEGSRSDRPLALSHIYVKLIGEGKPLRITGDSNADFSPAWSPDGQSIAFVRTLESDSRIYIVPALGGAERALAEAYIADMDNLPSRVSWSPDGRFLATAERTAAQSAAFLSLINVRTGQKVPLTTTDSGTSDMDPSFSPDGQTLLFIRHGIHPGMNVLRLTKDFRPLGDAKPIGPRDQYNLGAAWAADGRDTSFTRITTLAIAAH